MKLFYSAFSLASRQMEALDSAARLLHQADRVPAMSRRTALKATATLAITPFFGSCSKERRLEKTKVAIVGGGIAGLTAAYWLKQEGMSPTVYEASTRFGGRMHTMSGILEGGKTFEAGGEFIDSNHSHILGLVDRFGLALDDLETVDAEGPKHLFSGVEVSMEEIVEATVPFLSAFLSDQAALAADYDGQAAGFDALTCTEYFDSMGIGGVLRKVLQVAVRTEFGLESWEVSALHFV